MAENRYPYPPFSRPPARETPAEEAPEAGLGAGPPYYEPPPRAQAMPGRRAWFGAALVGVVAGAAAGAIAALLVVLLVDDDPAAGVPAATIVQNQLRLEEESAVTQAVEKALAGVVVIYGSRGERQTSQGIVEATDVGSGVIIDSRGYVVTNAHVVLDAQQLTVVLPTGEERPAILVSHDSPFTDLAVLKIQEGDLQPVTLGDSDALKLGQRVIAIGNALNINESTITTGVVSGLHRTWPREGIVMTDLVQTDAAINHGNSGGALVNSLGELVGITTTIIRRTAAGDVVEGIGFAISSKTIADVVPSMIEFGEYPRPDLGIVHEDITLDVASAFRLPESRGALITEVFPGGPADAAGLELGDIILEINGLQVNESNPLYNRLKELEPNQTVPITFSRNGVRDQVDVTLGKRQIG